MAGGLFGKFQAQREDEDPALAAQRPGVRPPMGGGAPATSHHGVTPGMPPGPMQPRAPKPTTPATPEQIAMVNISRPADGSLQPSDVASLMAAMNARAAELQNGPMPDEASDIDLALRGGAPFSPDDLASAGKPDFAYDKMADPLRKLLMLHTFQQQQRGGSGNPWD